MRIMRYSVPVLLLAGLVGCGQRMATTQAPADNNAELTEVTYAGLDQAVQEQKGKVVMIDIWSLG